MVLGLISFTSIPPEVTIASSIGRNARRGILKSFKDSSIFLLSSLVIRLTFFLSAIAGIDAAGASIFSIFLYVMIYLKYCQACQSLADFGIRLTWMKICKIVSPVLYIPALVLAILWLSAS